MCLDGIRQGGVAGPVRAASLGAYKEVQTEMTLTSILDPRGLPIGRYRRPAEEAGSSAGKRVGSRRAGPASRQLASSGPQQLPRAPRLILASRW